MTLRLCVTYPINFLEFGLRGTLEILTEICVALIFQLRIQRRKMDLIIRSFSIVLAVLFLISKIELPLQSSLIMVAIFFSAFLNVAYAKRKGNWISYPCIQ